MQNWLLERSGVDSSNKNHLKMASTLLAWGCLELLLSCTLFFFFFPKAPFCVPLNSASLIWTTPFLILATLHLRQVSVCQQHNIFLSGSHFPGSLSLWTVWLKTLQANIPVGDTHLFPGDSWILFAFWMGMPVLHWHSPLLYATRCLTSLGNNQELNFGVLTEGLQSYWSPLTGHVKRQLSSQSMVL